MYLLSVPGKSGFLDNPLTILFSKQSFFKKLFPICLFLAVLGLRCCARAFSSCGARASHCGGFFCCGARALGVWASVVVARRLSSCGLRAPVVVVRGL